MAYETYDNLPRGAGEPNYFEATDPRYYSSQFAAEPRDTNTASSAPTPARHDDDYPSSTRMQPSVPAEAGNNKMTTDHSDTTAPATVSPELIAELTERIKKEGG